MYLHEIGDVDLFGAPHVFYVLRACYHVLASRVRQHRSAPSQIFEVFEDEVRLLYHILFLRKVNISSRSAQTWITTDYYPGNI